MKLVEKAKYKNRYIVEIDGYFGDMDESFHDTHEYKSLDKTIDALKFFKEWKKIRVSSLKDLDLHILDMKSRGMKVSRDSFNINYDYDDVGTIESINVIYYDENGYGHHMEIEE